MTTIRTKLKRALLLIASSVLFLGAFIIDIIRKVDIDSGLLGTIRNVGVFAAFVLFYLLLESLWKREQRPAKKLGFALVLTIVVGVAVGLLFSLSDNGFDAKNYILIPQGFDAIIISNILGVLLGITMLIVLLLIRDIIVSKQRKGTRRNFLILVALMVATSLSTLPIRPMESSFFSSMLFIVTIVAMAMNSFRLSWIVYLSKREKLFSMVYGFLLFGLFIGFDVLFMGSSNMAMAVRFYSRQVTAFSSMVSVFATIYFGMTFLSTLFHLPTAEAFDRKISEVASLHNLSRLVTQVFDFNELTDSVTRMTLDVCQAKSSWLEIIKASNVKAVQRGAKNQSLSDGAIETVSLKNVSLEETLEIVPSDGDSVRRQVLEGRKPIVIDNVDTDKRLKHLSKKKRNFESMVIVPLLSHDRVIGILYATKEMPFGFDQEDVDVISAFADQATIAIENSRLIEKSLERERLVREMMVAQDMQKKLLPQQQPLLREVELEALSTPAFEVGGDYYDFTMLDEHHLAIIVGDVSGKGVSAAFYMAEMKGIFQSLSRIYREPKQFLARAHEALAENIDKRSFISVIYAVLDLRDGTMSIARAGHCPMLYISKQSAKYIQPTGLGLGIGTTDFFEKTIIQESIKFSSGDAAIFFTDGITEARQENGEEYGYDRLLDVGRQSAHFSALGIRDAIIASVDRHMNHQPPEDDLTLVVIKWLKQ